MKKKKKKKAPDANNGVDDVVKREKAIYAFSLFMDVMASNQWSVWSWGFHSPAREFISSEAGWKDTHLGFADDLVALEAPSFTTPKMLL